MKKHLFTSVILACLLGLSACSISDFEESTNFISADSDIHNIIITNNTQDSHEVYVVNSSRDIDRIKKRFEKVSEHLWCSGNGSYNIGFYNNRLVDSAPYPAGISAKQVSCIKNYMTPENRRYIYTFYVPDTVYFEKLRDNIIAEQECMIFLPYMNHQLNPSVISETATPSEYDLDSEYKILLIFENELDQGQIEQLCKVYGIASFDYDKLPLEIEQIVVFKRSNSTSECDFYTITPDLRVRHREFNTMKFTPFKDEPQFSIESDFTLSQEEYDALTDAFTRYDFLTIAEEPDEEEDSLNPIMYLAITIDGNTYFSCHDISVSGYSRFRFQKIWDVARDLFDLGYH